MNVKHDFFKNTFFPLTITEWDKLDLKIKNSESVETFLKKNSIFCICEKGEVETSSHYLHNCSNYSEERLTLLNTIKILTCP